MVTEAYDQLELSAHNQELAGSDAESIIRWAADTFGPGLVMTSSFGAQSALMLHMVTRIIPQIPVVFIDTGYLFPETYRFAAELAERLNLNLKVYQPLMTTGRLEALHGQLWNQGPQGIQRYNQIMKVEPMQRALRELDVKAWIAGLRAEQTDHRASLETLTRQNGHFKVHPILNWTTRDVHNYLKKHDLPYHPLYHLGYKSIGDVHSTLPITAQDTHERSGRFKGMQQECGIHLPQTEQENVSLGSSAL